MEKMGTFDKYEVENACDTLLRAEEIKKNPELMAEVSKIIDKKHSAITSLKGLRAKKAEILSGKEKPEPKAETKKEEKAEEA